MASSLWIKICGVTSVEDACAVAEAGADAIGLNFAPESPRLLGLDRAREIVRAVGSRVEWVGVFVDAEPDFLRRAQDLVGLDWLQLHGSESRADVQAWGGRAFKALRIGEARDVDVALGYPGDRLLVDAKVSGAKGGTGETFDWSLLAPLSQRRVVLAGGLKPENVAEAIRLVKPFGIDTASGVESVPGRKDHARVLAFVRRARAAAGESGP